MKFAKRIINLASDKEVILHTEAIPSPFSYSLSVKKPSLLSCLENKVSLPTWFDQIIVKMCFSQTQLSNEPFLYQDTRYYKTS